MCLLDVDREESNLSDEEWNKFQDDEDMYLERFEDPFRR